MKAICFLRAFFVNLLTLSATFMREVRKTVLETVNLLKSERSQRILMRKCWYLIKKSGLVDPQLRWKKINCS